MFQTPMKKVTASISINSPKNGSVTVGINYFKSVYVNKVCKMKLKKK